MNRFKTPLVLVTTIQPVILLWIMAISFFLALALASAIAHGRTWHQTTRTWLLSWLIFSIIGIVATNLLGVTSVYLEWVFGA